MAGGVPTSQECLNSPHTGNATQTLMDFHKTDERSVLFEQTITNAVRSIAMTVSQAKKEDAGFNINCAI